MADLTAATLARIVEKLELLRSRDPHREVFGADLHHYRCNPPLSQAQLSAAEARHGIRLPHAFRQFLLHVADGGAGPEHGLSPLSHSAHRDLKTAFVPPDLSQIAQAPFESVALPPGCLILGHKGCAYYNLLITSGPLRGQVWFDYNAGADSLHYAERDFLRWYERWLDRGLEDRRHAKERRDAQAQDLHAALHANAADVEARVDLAALHLEIDQRPEAAQSHLDKALRLAPGHARASELQCRLLKERAQWADLAACAQSGLLRALQPFLRAQLLCHQGIGLEAQRDYAGAVRAFEQALKLDGRVGMQSDGARLPAARAHRALGNLEQARALLKGAPATALVRYELGHICMLMGLLEEACTEFEKAARLASGASIGSQAGAVPDDVKDWLHIAREARDARTSQR